MPMSLHTFVVAKMNTNTRKFVVFLLDVGFVAAAIAIAYLLRTDFTIHSPLWLDFGKIFGVILVVKPLTFLASKLYRSIWRYASIPDVIELLKTVSIGSLLTKFTLFLVYPADHYSRAIFILDWGVLFSLMCASRLLWRGYLERVNKSISSNGLPTLIIGAGNAGNHLVQAIRHHSHPTYNVIGFVDDDESKLGMQMNGVPVLGRATDLSRLVKEHAIEQVILAVPTATREQVRAIIRRCQLAMVKYKTLPHINDFIDCTVQVSQIKEVEIEDLLGREPAVLDTEAISSYLKGKRIMVTGAAGSIGSEICRQVAKFTPCHLILFDNAETPLYNIERELSGGYPSLRIIPVLGDVRDRKSVERVFADFMPEVVFHAAAYKHVPLIEYNPLEAVINNIKGTSIVADAAEQFGATDFVMVSTDKAVNPSNVMGCCKRVAELYVQGLSGGSRTKYTTVRFGNVLGSQGSVIPLFKEQIGNGGPLTITDPNVVRYFMTISEASQLVLQAGCLGKGGEIFVLDMGEPVAILELAEELIRLSGLTPYEDIDITFTGLRPGEKMFEELSAAGEKAVPTSHQKIKVLSAAPIDFNAVKKELGRMYIAVNIFDIQGVMESLNRLVPEFAPHHHYGENPPEDLQRVRPDLFRTDRLDVAGTRDLSPETRLKSVHPPVHVPAAKSKPPLPQQRLGPHDTFLTDARGSKSPEPYPSRSAGR